MSRTRLYIMNYQGFKEYIEDEVRVCAEAMRLFPHPSEHLKEQHAALQALQLINSWEVTL